MDPETTIGTGLAVFGSKDLLVKILGPTADYVGGEIQGFVKKCNVNLENIFKKTERKLGEKINSPGQVSPRVLKHIIDEGRFCENEVTAEYYAGILASSRTEDANDDRGVYLLNLVNRLSCYQIRAHYILYSLLRHLYYGSPLNLGHYDTRSMIAAFIPYDGFWKSMGIDENTIDPDVFIPHVMHGLNREEMIGKNWLSGPTDFLNQHSASRIESDGIIFQPSPFGMELLMWTSGFGDQSYKKFLHEEIEFPIYSEVSLCFDGSRPTSIMDRASIMEENIP